MVWRHTTEEDSGFLYSLSDSIRIVEESHSNLLVPVSDGTMFVVSDYSGQHKEATHEAYSFLITTEDYLVDWLPNLASFRNHELRDGRRLSFKKLKEPMRWRALPNFLDMASQLKGNLFTIMVDRRIGSFMDGGPSTIKAAFPDCFPSNLPSGTIEKMFRLASFNALIISGFRREDQLSKWISDHDEALDSYEKREQFGRLASYLTFGLTHWRTPADSYFCTTELPGIPDWAEDVAAIPDLIAGSYCQMSSQLPAFFDAARWATTVSPSSVNDLRARAIGSWLTMRGNLKQVLLRLEMDDAGKVRSTGQAFLGYAYQR